MKITDIHVKQVVHPELDAIAFGIADVVLVSINRQTAKIQYTKSDKHSYVVKTLIEILENAV